MSLIASANLLRFERDIVKEMEEYLLIKIFCRIRMSDVCIIDINEIYVGHEWGENKRRQKYLTRGAGHAKRSGAVRRRWQGHREALNPFNARISRFKANIVAICMDMSDAYAKWVRDNLLNATVVYDHFHVIQLANQKLDQIRRQVQGKQEKEAPGS